MGNPSETFEYVCGVLDHYFDNIPEGHWATIPAREQTLLTELSDLINNSYYRCEICGGVKSDDEMSKERYRRCCECYVKWGNTYDYDEEMVARQKRLDEDREKKSALEKDGNYYRFHGSCDTFRKGQR